jgi:hypothetical protein
MAKRGGSGKSSFQDLCAHLDPSKDSWPALERRLLEAKSHLLALRPADAEAVTNFMIAMQLHTVIKQGTLLPDEIYREAYRLVLDGVEQELDAPGQLRPLSLAKMKEVGAQLQVTLQSRGISEVSPKIAAANKNANELANLKARMRKLEAGGGGKPPDKPPPDKTTSGPPRGGGRGKGRGRGRSGRVGGQELTAPTEKCFVCGKVGCKPSTCPNGNPDAQKEHPAKKAERERANSHRQVRRLQGACNVSNDTNGWPFTLIVPDESVSDPNLTDSSLIPVGRLKEEGFHVSFRIPVEVHLDGVDLTVYPKYGGKIVTPKPDSRTIFIEYEHETWRLPKPTIALKRVLPTLLVDHATLNGFFILAEQRASNEQSNTVQHSTRNEEDQRKFELMCRRQKEAAILHESYGHRNPTSLVKDLKAAGIPIKHLQRYLHAYKCKYCDANLGRASYY